jgi:putative colanic acid biosynthesis glycosyltransferase
MNEPHSLLSILMINSHLTLGGAAKMAATLTRALNLEGDVSATLHHCGNSRNDGEYVGHRVSVARPLNALLARLGGAGCVWDFGLAKSLKTRIEQADVVHLHNLHGYYLDWTRLFSYLRHKPVVWTWHDMWGATGRCGVSYDCDGWTQGCKPCPHKDYYPAAWFDFAAGEYKAKSIWLERLSELTIVSPSYWLRDIAIARGVPADLVQVIPNPVDTGAYRARDVLESRRALGIDPNKRYVLFVATDCRNHFKGYEDFILAVRSLGWGALVVGKGAGEQRDGFIHLGELKQPEALVDCYSAADALLVPSKFDNYPNTIIESLACGTPAFGYNVGGIPTQVHPEVGGVVERGDAKGLAALVESKLPGGKTAAISEMLSSYAHRIWESSTIAKQYLAIYRATVDRR